MVGGGLGNRLSESSSSGLSSWSTELASALGPSWLCSSSLLELLEFESELLDSESEDST
jgi:hypothetical protein